MTTTWTQQQTIDAYWRPGCGFCSAMRTSLVGAGIDADWHSIWDDPDDAAFVRPVANGNDTVPTIRIGGRVLVSPRPRQVVDLVAGTRPHRRTAEQS